MKTSLSANGFPRWRNGICVLALLVSGLLVSCSRDIPPPEPLALDQIPAAMEKAFSTASPELKSAATEVVNLIGSKDHAKAFNALQALFGKSGLSKEQVSVVSRASLTFNTLLQEAQAAGDQKAANTLKNYQYNK